MSSRLIEPTDFTFDDKIFSNFRLPQPASTKGVNNLHQVTIQKKREKKRPLFLILVCKMFYDSNRKQGFFLIYHTNTFALV
jgi:hypothetical protein